MRNRNKVLKNTTNSRVYKMAAARNGCPICSPHRGCNRKVFGQEKNWKKFRKTQYKHHG